jgi:small subunit ribosomal protein S16
MLIIRLQRIGKKHAAEYRLVVAEKKRHVSKQVNTVLGNYNPVTKKLVLKHGADVNKYIDLNIEQSDTVRSILKKNGFEKKAVVKATKAKAEPKATAAKEPATKKTVKKVTKA